MKFQVSLNLQSGRNFGELAYRMPRLLADGFFGPEEEGNSKEVHLSHIFSYPPSFVRAHSIFRCSCFVDAFGALHVGSM